MSSTTHPKTDLPQARKSSDRGPPASPDPESRAIAYPPPSCIFRLSRAAAMTGARLPRTAVAGP